MKTGRSISRLDIFPNFYKTVLSIADAALQYNTWDTGFSIKDGYGFVIHKMEFWIPGATMTLLNADQDNITTCLVANNTLTGPQLLAGTGDSVIDQFNVSNKWASAVGMYTGENKWIHDFTNEPGGGRLVAPKPLYFGSITAGLGAAATVNVKVVYTMLKLTAEVYRELYESMNPSA